MFTFQCVSLGCLQPVQEELASCVYESVWFAAVEKEDKKKIIKLHRL